MQSRKTWWVLACAAVLLPRGGAAAPAGKMPAKKPPARPAAVKKPLAKPTPAPTSKAPAPKAPAPKPAARLTTASIAPTLRALGYAPETQGGYQRLRVEEESYGYYIDVKLTPSEDWLVCMAHLAPVPDLTKVPSAPLLTLLGMNDALLGMYFSYDRANARIMLNAAVPVRGFEPEALKVVLEGLKTTVKKTEGLWDPSQW